MTDFMVCSEFGLKRYKAGENSDEGVFASAKKVAFGKFSKISFFFKIFIKSQVKLQKSIEF